MTKDFATQIFLQKGHPEFDLMLADSVEQVFRMVSEGKATAALEAVASMEFAKRKLRLDNLKVAAPTPYTLNMSIGIRKDWPELVSILNKSLAGFHDEEKALIRDKWLKIRVERHVDWGFIIKAGVLVGCAVGIILAIILIWNRRMAREVAERKQAEDRFQNMAANVPGAIIQMQVNPDGKRKYLYLNQRSREFFGVAPEVAIKESRLLVSHPADKERLEKDFQYAVEKGRELNFVGRIVLPDGEIKWVRINASPTPSPEGGYIYNGFILDITDRKLAEQEYLASERKIKAMSQAVDDALVMTDNKDKVLFWNPAAEKLFGYSSEEAMGKAFHEIAAPDAYREKIGPGLKRFAETGQGPVLGTTTEVIARNRAGKEFPVEVTLSSFRMEGEWFAVGTVRDISQRKKAEQALRESEQRLEMALEGGNLGIWDADLLEKRTVVDERWAKIMDTELEEVHNAYQLWMDSIHPDDEKRTRQLGRKYRSGLTDIYEVEYRIITKKGNEKMGGLQGGGGGPG